MPFSRYASLLLISALAGFFILLNISCAKRPDTGDVVIRINDYNVPMEEFETLYAEYRSGYDDTSKMRDEFIEQFITRKLFLQEAERLGLDRKDDFLKSVENFWEQSLLKLLIDHKTRETMGRLGVSEEDIREQYDAWMHEHPESVKSYDEMREVLKWHTVKEREALMINSWIGDLKSQASIYVDERIIEPE